ncbi:MAG: SDR family NAD(P)-dependent oxidoreductase [Planctomycetota bacterium]|nr:SDR family NAD(P)-dependent oxidoreductase [Planctomycetota bacterium]
MELKDKTMVITGGASGIGFATCEALMKEGLEGIAVVDRSEAVNDACHRLNSEAGGALYHPYIGDVTCEDFRRSVFADLKKRFGVVHMCVPAAGITRDRLAVKINRDTGASDLYSVEEFRSVIEINLLAPIYWAMESIATMAEDRHRRGVGRWDPKELVQGAIVLIGSVSSAGNKGQISYATTKAGLDGAQATLAKEAIFHGVRCCIIHPGYTDTPMVQALGDEMINEMILPNTLLRRLLRPDEVAEGIVFMLRSSAASGSLWLDAGWHPAT